MVAKVTGLHIVNYALGTYPNILHRVQSYTIVSDVTLDQAVQPRPLIYTPMNTVICMMVAILFPRSIFTYIKYISYQRDELYV